MWRWCAYLSGVLLVAVALVAVPSVAVVESYVGGSAVHGSVEDGRSFVNPGHGMPAAEVSESTWRAVYWVERLWPWSALIPTWVGMFLMVYGKGANWKPPPPPPKELPPWMIRACSASALVTVAGTWLFWVVVRLPWATMLVGWVLGCICCGMVVRLYYRSLPQQSAAEPSSGLPRQQADRDPRRPSPLQAG